MATDEPPYLTIGTDVSAKYKGAFCEAKIKKVNRIVKCKVNFKNNLGTFLITDDQIKGTLRIGAEIDAKHPEKGQFMEAVINKVQDYSQYTVVFDDGDETTLRRTSLCLKSGRHFAESPTLDQFPLTNPEHFSSPVIGTSKLKRKRRSTMNSSLDYESSDDDSVPRKVRQIRDKEQNPDLGKVVCVDYGDRRKKENWYPGLIVPHPAQSTIKISKEEHLIRSFKDGKYYQVPKRDIREFVKDAVQKVENNSLRTAVEKATNYLEKDELPPHWDKALFAGLDSQSADEESHDSDSDTSDDEPSEEKDRFVAQLYKFMDERGTPINKAPVVSNRDLNLYKLFRIMHKLGGYNKVTNKNKWKTVYTRMGLPQSNLNGPNQIKLAYKRFLQSFEDFYRKLGCTMVSNSRSTRGRHRSDRNIMITRTRERDTASPKGRNAKDTKEKIASEKKTDEKLKVAEKKEIKQEETPKSTEKLKSPEKKRVEKSPDEKDSKQKKDEKEKPRLVRSQSLTKDKKEIKPEKARTREDARKEKNESPEKKGTRSNTKIEPSKKEKEESPKDKKEKLPKEKDKKEEKPAPKEVKEEKPKVKKDDKVVRDRKALREKKIEEKSPKEKRENPLREKRERDSSREDKGSPKVKKEDTKVPEERSPKRKIERPTREKTEDKTPKTRLEDKITSLESSKKPIEDTEAKSDKEEKPVKIEPDVKKEEVPAKEKLRPKLRDRKEDIPAPGDESVVENIEDADEIDEPPLEDVDKKFKLKSEDGEEPPSKNRKRFIKSDDKDDKESLLGISDSDESFTNDSEKSYGKEIDIGDRVKVKYGRGRLQKVYEAKVLKIEMDGPDKRYYVHYAGWNTRYDEWVKKSYIVACISSSKKGEQNLKNSLSATNLKKIDRGKPPGISNNVKLDRKNSTSSISSRATRSDKKGSLPLSSGLEPKKRTRKKSGTMTSTTDVSQESDTDGADLMDLDDDDAENSMAPPSSLFKEELFSDDEEKEKLEDAKRGDITKLEKAISVEESGDDKDLLFGPILEGNDSCLRESVSTITDNLKKEDNLPVKETSEIADTNLDCDKLSSKPEDKPSINATCEFKDEADVSFPSDLLPEIKTKTPEGDLIGSLNNSATSPDSDKIEKSTTLKISPPTESKSALSFAGLIQKSTSENVVSPPPKTTVFSKVMSTAITSFSSVSVEKLNLESKSVANNVFKPVSMFGSIIKSPPQCTLSTDTFEEKFSSKPSSNIFSCILKSDDTANSQIIDVEPSEKSKFEDSSHNLKICNPISESPKVTSQESSTSIEVKTEPEAKPLKFCTSDIEETENKSKDKFDILLQSTSTFNLNPQKLPEVKNSIFDFSFGSHGITNESLVLQPLPSSISSISRIQTKSSDAVDLSRMIPGILERLEKDDVTDSKESSSLPPPKEGLGFDFLRGSQSISKPLSCSDSSNSLKICESDTNDSNTESKDLVINEKLEMPIIVPPDTCSSSLEEKVESIQIPEVVSETSLLTSSSASIPDPPKEKVVSIPVTSQPASVITAATITAPILEIISPTNKEKETDILKIPILPQENIFPQEDKFPLSDNCSSPKANVAGVFSPETPVENSPDSLDIVAEKEVPEKKEPVESLPEINAKSEKETLFEEIKTISNYSQSSVIKCVINPSETKISDTSVSPSLVKDEAPEEKDEAPEEKEEAIEIKESFPLQMSGLDAMADAAAIKEDSDMHNAPENQSNQLLDMVTQESDLFSQMSKKDMKKKKLGKKIAKKLGSTEISEKEDKDLKVREGKNKSKKRLRMEASDGRNLDLKSKSKKLKKNKNKKRFSRHEDQFGDAIKKFDFREEDHRDSFSDKIRRKEKKRNEKKFLKCGMKHEDFLDSKGELSKKKKSKKNRDKFMTDKKDFFEKKTKKKRKCHMEENQDTDSEKETPPKLLDKKRKKERKKIKVKDCSSSDDAPEKFFKEKSKDVASTSNLLMRRDSKSDDPDMSFLLCEEKVPASPADMADDSTGSSSNEDGDTLNSGIDLLPSSYPCSSRDPSNNLHKHNIDNVLDNTPPTTPSSTESLLSSSPSHERDSFPVSYAENTQSGEGESDLFHVSTNRTVAHGSEEYHAATTLAFAVCKSVAEKPKDDISQGFAKSPRSDHSSSKRKKKRVLRYTESVKSPKHKSSFPRMSKVESYCEDSSGTSAATSSSPPYSNLSSLNFSKSLPHRQSSASESSRYFYIPLHEKDPEKRIAVLQDKMAALRKKYLALRAEVIAIDHKRRKARKKIKEAGGNSMNTSVQSEDGQSCS